jgi:hypothetical protein
MPRARLFFVALLVLASVVVSAGCSDGGGSDEVDEQDYVAELSAIARSVTDGVDELSAQVRDAGSLKGAGKLLGTFSERLDDLAARVEDVSPPAQVTELHGRLVTLLEQLADKAGSASVALKAGDLLGGLPKLTKIAAEGADVAQKIDSTVGDIKTKLGLDG